MRTTTQKAAMGLGVVFLLVGVLGVLVPGGMGMEAGTTRRARTAASGPRSKPCWW